MAGEFLSWVKDLDIELTGRPAHRLFGSGVSPNIELIGELLAGLTACKQHAWGNPELVHQIQERYAPGDDRLAVQLTAGATGAATLACLALLETGDSAVIESPCYQPLIDAAEFAGAGLVKLERKGDEFPIDPDRVASVTTARTRLVIVTSPHNPSGALLDEKALLALADRASAKNRDVRILVDETFLDMVSPERRPRCAAVLDERFLSISSLTKSYGLGCLRCGWVLGDRRTMEAVRSTYVVTQNIGSELLEALDVKAFHMLDRFAGYAQSVLSANQAALDRHLRPLLGRQIEGWIPEHGCVCFLRFPGVADAGPILERWAKTRSLHLTPGSFFGCPERFRVGFGGHPQAVEDGLQTLAEALEQG